MSDQFKRRRRRNTSGYRGKLIPVEEAKSLPIGKLEMAACVGVAIVVIALISLVWIVSNRAIREQRADVIYRTEQMLSAQAATIAETIGYELLLTDQSLKIVQEAWKVDNDSVNLQKWKDDFPALTSVADDLFIADDKHVIRQDIVAKAIGQSVGAAYVTFPHGSLETYQSDGTQDREASLLRGDTGAPIDAREFLMYIVRPLDHPQGWLVGASYHSAELPKLFANAGLGYNPVVALVELDRGVVQAVVGPAARRPQINLSASPLFGLMTRSTDGVWQGVTAIDGQDRVHAFHRIKDRDMAVLIGASSDEVTAASDNFAAGVRSLAVVGSVLLVSIGGLVLWELYTLRAHNRRERILTRNRRELDRLRTEEVATAARTKLNSARLGIVLKTISDGVALFDTGQHLVQWNHAFFRGIGIPLRADMTLEAMIREQIATGLFGEVEGADAEVARRLTVLRGGEAEGLPQPGPDGETLTLRGLTVEEGGFMLLLNGLARWEAPPVASVADDAEEKKPETAAPAPIEW
jgi:PAS domain-containing protein